MTTTGKTQRRQPDERLLPGMLLRWTDAAIRDAFFVIVGTTHAEVAMLRLRVDEGPPPQAVHFYELRYKVSWRVACADEAKLHADLSHFIIKTKDDMLPLVDANDSMLAGRVNHRDMAVLVAQLRDGRTISREQKDKFLPVRQ